MIRGVFDIFEESIGVGQAEWSYQLILFGPS